MPYSLNVSGQCLTGGIYYISTSLCILNISGLLTASGISSYSFTQVYTTSGNYISGDSYRMNTTTDGSYDISMSFTDLANNTVNAPRITAYVETVNPTQPTISVSGGDFSNNIYYLNASGAAFYLNVSGLSGLSGETPMYYYTYNQSGAALFNFSGAYAFGNPIPFRTTVDGSYSIYVTFTDLALRSTTTLPINVFLESSNTSQPTLSISGGDFSNNIYYTNSSGVVVNVSGLATASAFSTFTYSQSNTVGFVSPTPTAPIPSYTLSTSKPGTYTVYATFKDSQGNSQTIGPITIVRQ